MDFNKYVPANLCGTIIGKEKVIKNYGVNPQGEYYKIINHPVMAPFTHIKQLGPVSTFFPSGKTRNDHINAMMKMYVDVLKPRMKFKSELDFAIICLALVHDIGHAPTSHLLEFLFPQKHHEYGLEKLRKLKDTINICGKNETGSDGLYDLVEMLYRSMDEDINNPIIQRIHEIVCHVLLGLDKLEYGASDPSDTGLVSENYHGSTYLDTTLRAIQWDAHRGIGIHLKRIKATVIQAKRYVDNYCNIYFNRQNQLAYRTYQRAIYDAFCPDFNSDAGTDVDKELEGRIRSCSDEGLMSILSQQAKGNARLENIFSGENFHNEGSYKQMAAFVTERSRPFVYKPEVENVEILSENQLNKICKLCSDATQHVRLENKLARIINLEPGELLISPMESIERFKKRICRMNCMLYYPDDQKKEGMLFDEVPYLKDDLLNTYTASFSISIDIIGNKREALNGKFGKFKAEVLEAISKYR